MPLTTTDTAMMPPMTVAATVTSMDYHLPYHNHHHAVINEAGHKGYRDGARKYHYVDAVDGGYDDALPPLNSHLPSPCRRPRIWEQ
jgi:hypothetical protein